MLAASLAVLYWLGIAAADPMGPMAAPDDAQAQSSSTVEASSAGVFQFEIQFECCDGLGTLGRSIVSAVASEPVDRIAAGTARQCGAFASFSCAPCETRTCTALADVLVCATALDANAHCQPCGRPLAAGALVCFGGGENSQCASRATTISGSVVAERSEDDVESSEGACHVRNLGVAQLRYRPLIHPVTNPHETAIPWHMIFQSPESPFPLSGPYPPSHVPQVEPPRPVYVTAPQPQWIHHPGAGPGDVRGRIEHMTEAARHLEAAGMHAEAHELRHRVQQMEHQARALIQEKEAQLRQLEHELAELRGLLRDDASQVSIAIPAVIFKANAGALESLREHIATNGSGPVNRAEFQRLIEELLQSGMVEIVSRPQVLATCGSRATIAFQVPAGTANQHSETICSLRIRPELHDGCCRLEMNPEVRTSTPLSTRLQSSQLSVDLDPSQGIVTELAGDGSLLAFVSWNIVHQPQPTAAAVPSTISSGRRVHPVSAEWQRANDALPGVCLPQPIQVQVAPLFPQPFPARVPQSPSALQPPPAPLPSAELSSPAANPYR